MITIHPSHKKPDTWYYDVVGDSRCRKFGGIVRSKVNVMRKNQHVVPHGSDWAVRGEGNERVTSVHSTQAHAIKAAREIAKNQRSEVVIHRSDGRVRDRDSFGNDPLPPKSPRKVLFPTTPTATNQRLIRKAVSEVIRESKTQHVVPHGNDWAVRGEGNERVTSVHSTQADAIKAARGIVRNQRVEIVIHRPDGRIRNKDSYGNDPKPRRDRKH